MRIVLCQGLLNQRVLSGFWKKARNWASQPLPASLPALMAGLKDAGAAKIQRWQRILQEATEQCGRTIQPELLPIPLAESGTR